MINYEYKTRMCSNYRPPESVALCIGVHGEKAKESQLQVQG
jgi:hypothetical protein